MRSFIVIAAATWQNGIGLRGNLPWYIKDDLKHFQEQTSGHIVVMGYKTWLSLPKKPLLKRVNIVVTREHVDDTTLPHAACTFEEALEMASKMEKDKKIFVIGGARVYACALQHALCQEVIMTRILTHVECDTFMPPICDKTFEIKSIGETVRKNEENGIFYQMITYHRRHEEHQYLDLVKRVLDTGDLKPNRTGVDAFSTFGNVMRFSLLNNTIPLLTTKRVNVKLVIEELLWFIKGQPDIAALQAKGCHIWDDDVQRAGDLGPVYPFQWRHFGANYVKGKTDYRGEGIDQLQSVIDSIRSDPGSRRILISAWNPSQLPSMCLPACHTMAQFWVKDGRYLSCLMYQRSADVGVGLPFNIFSYALLTFMIAKVCALVPYEFIHCLADSHVYKNHVATLQEQLTRAPRPFPKLLFKPGTEKKQIDDIGYEDIQIVGYEPHGTLKMALNTGLQTEDPQSKRHKSTGM